MTHTLLTMEARSWIGMELEIRSAPITEQDIRKYVSATGDGNPLYSDAAVAKAHGYKTIIMPPLMYMPLTRQVLPSQELTKDGVPPDRRPPIGEGRGMNGETDATFLAPLYPGDSIVGRRRLANLEEKNGRTRSFVVATWETNYFNQHDKLVIQEVGKQILF